MKKGEATRYTILNQAIHLASQMGLEGLSIGGLAETMKISKSGLFAHFRSKEALQIQVLDAAAVRFIDTVVKPALAAPRGEPRIRAIFERWLMWASPVVSPGGCIFVAASIEMDDRPGPVRDHLVQLQQDWYETRRRVFQIAIDDGHLAADADAHALAHDLFSIMLGCHYGSRLLRDPKAEAHARRAFERLLKDARTH